MRQRKRHNATIARWLLLLVGLSLIAMTPARHVRAAAVLTKRVDATGVTASAWTSIKWLAPVAGPTTFTLSWTGGGDLRMDLRRASDLMWIASATTAANPKSMTANVQAGVSYQIAVWAQSGVGDFTVTKAGAPQRPNILIVLTDDQRRESLPMMPSVKKWFGAQGQTFTQGYVTTPSCCPSRAAILTGRYDHNNGVISQAGPAFDEGTSIARYLKDAGYATGHVGKYVHYYSLAERAPYWDRWTFWTGGYDNVYMNFDGEVRQSVGYSTRIAFDTAISYVNSWETRDSQPWMMLVAPTAPHLVGRTPPPAEAKYATAPVPAMVRNPSTLEADRSDKPAFLYCCSVTEAGVASEYTAMTRASYTIDDGVNQLMNRLAAAGELDNTIAFFLSDNGIMLGDHGLDRKFVPYTASVGVPFLVRWTGRIAPGTVDNRFMGNIDIAPTALAAAGVVPLVKMDGRDLLTTPPRTRRLTEYWQDNQNVATIPAWASVATTTYEYTEYYKPDTRTVQFREYYDMVRDPHQLLNLFADGNAANDPNVTAIAAQLKADRTCVAASCP